MTTELTRAHPPDPNARGARRQPSPRLDPALAHLSLPSVRAYRHMLAQEEFAATSWRRLISVHLAALADTERPGSAPSTVHSTGAGHGADGADLPAGSAWTDWVHQLHDLDLALVGYRESALERLARVTDELIARYHQDPSRCLAALPHHRATPER
jgi:hypothetical protein